MKRIHCICRRRLHLRPTKFPEFESGYWDVRESEAKELVGGMLYLHETKLERSYFGGVVKSYRVVDKSEEYAGRIAFFVQAMRDGKNVAWEGADHSMAWSGGIVDDPH